MFAFYSKIEFLNCIVLSSYEKDFNCLKSENFNLIWAHKKEEQKLAALTMAELVLV